MKLYSSIIEAKNSTKIPVFKSGKTMESRYNPEAEAEKKLLNQQIKSNIVLILGIGSGIYLQLLAEKYKHVQFIAVEFSEEDIELLKNLSSFTKLYTYDNIKIITINELENELVNYYQPAVYGNLEIIEQRAWIEENTDFNHKKIIENALKIITADFSVQNHFGKIWQRNIISNLVSIKNNIKEYELDYDNKKEAVIVAAGPSLDYNIEIIKQNRDKLFIISTDTAFQSLLSNNIIPEIVISIDGQNVSYNHFMNIKNNLKTIFVFDFCGNSKAVKHIINTNNNLFFINTGHPFISEINRINKFSIPFISAGAGTVTIAGFDLAVKLGFNKIKIFAADFSYLNGKPYSKGTYLDYIYQKNSNKINSFEKKFNQLQYRTELKKININQYTTEILESYKSSLENYLKKNGYNFYNRNNIYEIEITEKQKKDIKISKQTIKYEDYFSMLANAINKISENDFISLKYITNLNLTGLLPYVSYLRTKSEYSHYSIYKFLKLAYKNIVRYN